MSYASVALKPPMSYRRQSGDELDQQTKSKVFPPRRRPVTRAEAPQVAQQPTTPMPVDNTGMMQQETQPRIAAVSPPLSRTQQLQKDITDMNAAPVTDENGRFKSSLLNAFEGNQEVAQQGSLGLLIGTMIGKAITGGINPTIDEERKKAVTLAKKQEELKAAQDEEQRQAEIRYKNSQADYMDLRPGFEQQKIDLQQERIATQQFRNLATIERQKRQDAEKGEKWDEWIDPNTGLYFKWYKNKPGQPKEPLMQDDGSQMQDLSRANVTVNGYTVKPGVAVTANAQNQNRQYEAETDKKGDEAKLAGINQELSSKQAELDKLNQQIQAAGGESQAYPDVIQRRNALQDAVNKLTGEKTTIEYRLKNPVNPPANKIGRGAGGKNASVGTMSDYEKAKQKFGNK